MSFSRESRDLGIWDDDPDVFRGGLTRKQSQKMAAVRLPRMLGMNYSNRNHWVITSTEAIQCQKLQKQDMFDDIWVMTCV